MSLPSFRWHIMSTHGDKTQSDRDRVLRGVCVCVCVCVCAVESFQNGWGGGQRGYVRGLVNPPTAKTLPNSQCNCNFSNPARQDCLFHTLLISFIMVTGNPGKGPSPPTPPPPSSSSSSSSSNDALAPPPMMPLWMCVVM